MEEPLRIVFAGTAEFAVPALQRLSHGPQQLVAVCTQPDRPAGRGRKLRASPVKAAAQACHLPVCQPTSLRRSTIREELAALAPDVVVVAAYGLILPATILSLPRLGCLNIHASLLPRWRGAAPIQRSILAGDRQTGITIMHMEQGLDTGAILTQQACTIGENETAGSVHNRLAALGAELIATTLPRWAAGEIKPQPQDPQLATYAEKLRKEEAVIDWQRPATEIARRVRAFNPWPVTYTRHAGQILRVWSARVLPDGARITAGSVTGVGSTGIDVATGEGTLRIEVVQIPGRRRQQAKEFLNGYSIAPGDRLG